MLILIEIRSYIKYPIAPQWDKWTFLTIFNCLNCIARNNFISVFITLFINTFIYLN